MSNYVKTPTVYQMEATECGAASLAMVFAYFGKHMPLEQLRIETGVSRDGCKAGNIMRAAKKFGFECHGYSKDPEFLKTVKPPCIIHWNFNHFVVFEGFKGNTPYINDPAVGRRKLTPEELDECFTGIVMTFAPTSKVVKSKKQSSVGSVIKARLHGQYGVIFKLLYIGLLLVLPGLILPVLSQVFLDDVLVAGHKDWLTKVLVFMGCCIALKFGLTYYRSLILQKLNSKMTLLSGYSFLRHMFRLPMSFFDQRYAGDLSERISNNTEVNTFLSSDLAKTVLNIMTAVFYLIILFLYSPILIFIGLINTIVTVILVILSNKALANYALKIQMSSGKLYGVVCAGLSITDTIKASGAEGEYTARVLGYQAKQSNLEQRLNRFQETLNSIPKAAGDITSVLMLMIGGILVIRGEMTIGMLVAFTSLYDSFCEPVNELVNIVHNYQTLNANIQRVNDIEKYPEDNRYKGNKPARDSFFKLSGNIELSEISFGYSILNPPLIDNLSFKLSSGESIAFVGASGCGKSTVSKIVSGLYQPWNGTIYFDNIPLYEIERERLISSISTVSQNITLFSGSIRDNITLWNPAVLEEDIIAAAKDACIHDFVVKLPGGYDYMLEEGGKNLSGGQCQRIEIARALATKPTILILDEATSALDPIVEKKILDNIKRRGCTCVVVAHRLSAIRDCNKIIVMHNGKIVQQGNHQSLMAQGGYYKAFVQSV